LFSVHESSPFQPGPEIRELEPGTPHKKRPQIYWERCARSDVAPLLARSNG
jgi:hypothetical protein